MATTTAKKQQQQPFNEIEPVLDKLFALKQQEKELKAEIKAVQEKVNAYSDAHYGDFVDGEMPLANGIIKIKSNPPKFVHESSHKALTVKERAELARELPEDYIEIKPNMSKIVARFNGDKLLKKQLVSKGVAVYQDVRYEAKPY